MCQNRQSGLSCCCWSLRRDDTACLQLMQLWTRQFSGQEKDSMMAVPDYGLHFWNVQICAAFPWCSMHFDHKLLQSAGKNSWENVNPVLIRWEWENTGCIQCGKCLSNCSLSGFPDSTFYIHRGQIILAYRDKKLCQLKLILYHNYQKMLFWPLKKIFSDSPTLQI